MPCCRSLPLRCPRPETRLLRRSRRTALRFGRWSSVIDTAGVIRYANANADYTRRPEPDETVEALQAIG